MLPVAPPLTAPVAEAWLAAGTPRWLTRYVPAVLWLVTVIVSVVVDTSQCTPADPSVCGPDHAFAWWFVVAVLTPFLLIWMPLLGCVAGLAFALADVHYDPVHASRIAWAGYGAVCLVVAGVLLRVRQRQREVPVRLGGGTQLPPQHVDPGWSALRVLTVAVMVPVTAASFWWYQRVSDAEQRHLGRAQVVQAEVIDESSEDSTITLAVPEGLNDARRLVVDVLDTHAYPVGGTTPLLLDPQDAGWERLVAEPYDPTGWESLSVGAGALALLSVCRELQRRRAVRRVVSSRQASIQVRVARVADELVLFPATGELQPFGALLVVEPDGPEADPVLALDDPDGSVFGELWRGEREMSDVSWSQDEGLVGESSEADEGIVEPAVLLGELCDGGWCVLVTPDHLLVPKRPLKLGDGRGQSWGDVAGKLPFRKRADAPGEAAAEAPFPGVPVEAAQAGSVLSLPAVARPLARTRLLGTLLSAVAVLAAPFAVLWVADGLYQRAVVVLVGGQVVLAGGRRSGQQVRIEHDHLEVVGPWRTTQVSWDLVHGARRDADVLLLAWEPDVVIELPPLELVGSALPPLEVALGVGATVAQLRERALATGVTNRRVRFLSGSTRGLLAVHAVVSAAVLWLVR